MNAHRWPKRLFALDVSRGIASLSVVLWHWQHFAYKGNSLDRSFEREGQPWYELLKLFYEKGGMGVYYFFVLSGFIFFWLYRESIKEKRTNAWTFFLQRFTRLYPLHFATLIVVAFLQWIYITREGVSFVYPLNDGYHFFLHLALASNWGFERGWSFNAPVWSVSIEVLLYAIFFVAVFFRQGGLLFSLSLSVGAYIWSFYSYHLFFKGLALFFCGGVVFQLTALISARYRFLKGPVYMITIAAWLSVIANFYVFDLRFLVDAHGSIGKYFLLWFPDFILFPFTICSLALMEIEDGIQMKPVSWVGDITYSTYLIHFPLQIFFGLMISWGLISPFFYQREIYLIVFFSLLILLSQITHKKFEMPLQKKMRTQLTPESCMKITKKYE